MSKITIALSVSIKVDDQITTDGAEEAVDRIDEALRLTVLDGIKINHVDVDDWWFE